MIQRHGKIDFGVVVTSATGQPLPEIVHEGVTYVVCTAGKDFKVLVSCKPPLCWSAGQGYLVQLFVDGNCSGSCYTLKEKYPSGTFGGWWLNHNTERAFVFSAPSTVQGDWQGVTTNPELGSIKAVFTEAEEYPCPALARVECSECNFLGHGTKTVTKTAPEEAASVKQADGKKFYLQPSLGVKAGARIDQEPYAKPNFHWRKKVRGNSYSLQVRFETAPILQLRKILVPSDPNHAQIIAASSNATRQQAARDSLAGPKQRAGGRASTSKASVIKKESKVVKKEKRQISNSGIIETVDLTEDAGEDQDCMMYTVAKRPKLEAVMLQID